jgi:hypothetical protein
MREEMRDEKASEKLREERPEDEGEKGFRMLGDVFGRVYTVTMLELYLQRNVTDSVGNEWGFGQILAILMLIGPLMELAELFTRRKGEAEDA